MQNYYPTPSQYVIPVSYGTFGQELILLPTPHHTSLYLAAIPDLYEEIETEHVMEQIQFHIQNGVQTVKSAEDPCSPHWLKWIQYENTWWPSREHLISYQKMRYITTMTREEIKAKILLTNSTPSEVWAMTNLQLNSITRGIAWKRHSQRITLDMLTVAAFQDKQFMTALLNPEVIEFDCSKHPTTFDQYYTDPSKDTMGEMLGTLRKGLIHTVAYMLHYVRTGQLVKYWGPLLNPTLIPNGISQFVATHMAYAV